MLKRGAEIPSEDEGKETPTKKFIDSERNPQTVQSTTAREVRPGRGGKRGRKKVLRGRSRDEEIGSNSYVSSQYLDLKKRYLSDPTKYREFKQLKYKSHIYNVGDAVFIKSEDDANNDFVCKLLHIFKCDTPEKTLVFVEVQWYYKKSDLPRTYHNFLYSISENELFLSTHQDIVPVECINGGLTVLTLQEYDMLSSIPPNTFFCRSKYDHVAKRLDPPPEDWEKQCFCNKPINPDLFYIMCDKCQRWLHGDCVHITLSLIHI
eukprot:TRINITY_DN9820_c0_g1_i20.p1 TRINITY_DN9820_c0_g1~~TRINITY_DN9820_c0_g1_i20.p1  ORF type:complete len:263 (-),score=50.17 TRINITY_DN9820_c0_g1_i20:61-849(-)